MFTSSRGATRKHWLASTMPGHVHQRNQRVVEQMQLNGFDLFFPSPFFALRILRGEVHF